MIRFGAFCSQLLVFFIGAARSFAADQPADTNTLWFIENYTKYEHLIPMRDGVRSERSAHNCLFSSSALLGLLPPINLRIRTRFGSLRITPSTNISFRCVTVSDRSVLLTIACFLHRRCSVFCRRSTCGYEHALVH